MVPAQMQNREYEKNLAKQRAKDDRNKQAQIRLPDFGASGSQPLFDAPIKQSGIDEDQKRHLDRILCPYEAVSNSLQMKYVGIERQPATPLPSRQLDEGLFSKPGNVDHKPSSTLHRPVKTHPVGDISQGGHGARKKLESSMTDRRAGSSSCGRTNSSVAGKPLSSASPSVEIKPKLPGSSIVSGSNYNHPGSATSNVTTSSVSATNSLSTAGSISATSVNSAVGTVSATGTPSASRTNGPSSHTSSSVSQSLDVKHDPEISLDRNSGDSGASRKKPMSSNYSNTETSTQSIKQLIKREPVLVSMNKELTCLTNPQSSITKNTSVNSVLSKASEKSDSKVHSDPLSVIKDNRNGAVFNGGSKMNRPRLHIPENVDEMLEEFHIPQPLTEIQTPFKEMRFPFQDVKKENAADKLRKGLAPSKQGSEMCRQSVVEEIQEKDTSSDSDSGSDSEDDDEEEEEGELDSSSDSDADKPTSAAEYHNSSGIKTTSIKSRDPPATVKVEPNATVATSGVMQVGSHPSAPVKEQRHQTLSSGESSSSGSDSSGSASDSESEDNDEGSEDDEEEEENGSPKKQTTPAKKSSPDYPDTTPSPSRSWGLKAFLQNKDQSSGLPYISKPASCEAPSSNKSDPDHFDEVTEIKRPADHISDENPPSVDPDSISKPMSADEFSPPAPVEKISMLSPIKSPQPVKSPVKQPSKKSLAMGTSRISQTVVGDKDAHDKVKSRERMSSTSNSTVPKSRRGRKKHYQSAEIVDSTSTDSDNDAQATASERASHKKSLPVSPGKSSNVCSTNSITTQSRKKESKRKNLSEELVRLKVPQDVKLQYSKLDCDKKTSTKSAPEGSGSIEEILKSFPEKTPLSPVHDTCQYNQSTLKQAGLRVCAEKPLVFNGDVSAVNGRPSVLVQIDLSLLENIMANSKSHAHFLEPLFNAKKSNQHSDISHNNQCPNDASSSKSTSRNQDSLHVVGTGSISGAQSDSSSRQQTNGLPDGSIRGSAIVVKKESVSGDSLSDSSSSDSEIEVKDAIKTAMNTSSSKMYSPSSQFQSHKNKRKLDSLQASDIKRQKTASAANVPPSQLSEIKRESENEKSGKSDLRRARHPSNSSQHSTHSNQSAVSNHSRASTSSSRHKKPRRDEPIKSSNTSLEFKPSTSSILSQPSHGRSTPQHSQSSSSGAAAASSSSRQQTPRRETLKHNGYLPGSRPVEREEERLKTADEYHQQATKYKHQADAMEMCLERYMLYVEAVLAFILSGCDMERNKLIVEATSMYKDTYKLISHHHHEFKNTCDQESASRAGRKLSVLCLRIQSIVYFKLYKLKKGEYMKLKRIIDDYFRGKTVKPPTSQPKPVSAPSPHQSSWNRSTGTPSPMSPTPSPANSVCSVGSVGNETPSKVTVNGSMSTNPSVPAGSVIVTQRIHSVIQRFHDINNYLHHAHELWDQADAAVNPDIKDFFAHLDANIGPLTLHSGLLHLVRYARQGIATIKDR